MKNYKSGYIALISAVIISFLLITVVISTSSISLNKLPLITRSQESGDVRVNLNSCVEESLLHLNDYGALPVSISISDYDCTVENIVNDAINWTYDVKISKNSYIYSVKVKTRRSDKVYLDSLSFNQ